MNEAQMLQAKVKPDWKPDEVQLVSMTYVLHDRDYLPSYEQIRCCQTLATSLDEAVKRAEKYYGPGHLNAWGAGPLIFGDRHKYGGGELLVSEWDADYAEGLERLHTPRRSSAL